MCRNPYIGSGGSAFGCGQCMPCRVNRRRVWSHRIMLEAKLHPFSGFWTLTYSDDNLPLTEDGLPTLDAKHLTDFMKRLRSDYQPLKLRYFNVGEYGDRTERPHYHLALFNYPCCERGRTVHVRRGNCCSVCERVERIWGFGKVDCGQLEDASAAYIAGYVTKKLTAKGDPRLKGRKEEFARMSLKPGIGAGFISEVASVILSHNLDSTLIDVPVSLSHGTSVKPLGRYLSRQLRKHVGKEEKAPDEVVEAQKKELQDVRQMAQETAPRGLYRETLKHLITEKYKGEYQRLEAKQKIYKKRGSI